MSRFNRNGHDKGARILELIWYFRQDEIQLLDRHFFLQVSRIVYGFFLDFKMLSKTLPNSHKTNDNCGHITVYCNSGLSLIDGSRNDKYYNIITTAYIHIQAYTYVLYICTVPKLLTM